MARSGWRAATSLACVVLVGGGLSGCGEDDPEPGRVTVSAAFIACRAQGCTTLPAWKATVELIRMSDRDTRVLTLGRDGTATATVAPGTYRVRMAFPELGIDPETVTTVEMRDGIDRDVVHVFEDRFDGRDQGV